MVVVVFLVFPPSLMVGESVNLSVAQEIAEAFHSHTERIHLSRKPIEAHQLRCSVNKVKCRFEGNRTTIYLVSGHIAL